MSLPSPPPAGIDAARSAPPSSVPVAGAGSLPPLVVVPTYEEADNVPPLVREVSRRLPEAHLLFVDDAGPDDTAGVVEAVRSEAPGRVHLLRRARKLGLGSAYVAGFRWALERGYPAAVEMDADLSHDPRDLPRLIALLAAHDVVVGSRYVAGGGTRNWSLSRRLISRCGSVYARLILRLPIHDLTGGFTAWRREVLAAIDLDDVRSDGYSFQIELKFRAHLVGFRLHETPIVFTDRRAGRSKMSARIVLEAIPRVWQLSLRRRSIASRLRGPAAPAPR